MNIEDRYKVRVVPAGPAGRKRGLVEQFEVWDLLENRRVLLSTSDTRDIAESRIRSYIETHRMRMQEKSPDSPDA